MELDAQNSQMESARGLPQGPSQWGEMCGQELVCERSLCGHTGVPREGAWSCEQRGGGSFLKEAGPSSAAGYSLGDEGNNLDNHLTQP